MTTDLTQDQPLSALSDNSLRNRKESSSKRMKDLTDDVVGFFRSETLDKRSQAMREKQGDIVQGVAAINTAIVASRSIDSLLAQLKSHVTAMSTAEKSERKLLSDMISNTMKEINSLVQDASYQGLNLLNSSSSELRVHFSERSNTGLVINGINMLGRKAHQNIFGLDDLFDEEGNVEELSILLSKLADDTSQKEVDSMPILLRINSAILKVRSNVASLNNHAALLDTRLEFTGRYLNSLEKIIDSKLIEKINDEGTKLLALQDKQFGNERKLAKSAQEKALLALMM